MERRGRPVEGDGPAGFPLIAGFPHSGVHHFVQHDGVQQGQVAQSAQPEQHSQQLAAAVAGTAGVFRAPRVRTTADRMEVNMVRSLSGNDRSPDGHEKTGRAAR